MSTGKPSAICGTGHRPPKLGGYSDTVMHRLIALADGWLAQHESSGGTANCIRYAEKIGRPVENLWNAWDPKHP